MQKSTNLKYYADQQSYNAHGTAVSEMEVKQVAIWNGEKTGLMFKTVTGNVLYLYADTLDEQKKWLALGSTDSILE